MLFYFVAFVHEQTPRQGRRRSRSKRRAARAARTATRRSRHPRNEKSGGLFYFSRIYVILGYEEARDSTSDRRTCLRRVLRVRHSGTSKRIAGHQESDLPRRSSEQNERSSVRQVLIKNTPTTIYTVCLPPLYSSPQSRLYHDDHTPPSYRSTKRIMYYRCPFRVSDLRS